LHKVLLACPKVNDKVKNEECVRDAVKDHPACTEVIVEERDSDRQNNEIDQQRQQHKQVPVEPTNTLTVTQLTEAVKWLLLATTRNLR